MLLSLIARAVRESLVINEVAVKQPEIATNIIYLQKRILITDWGVFKLSLRLQSFDQHAVGLTITATSCRGRIL